MKIKTKIWKASLKGVWLSWCVTTLDLFFYIYCHHITQTCFFFSRKKLRQTRYNIYYNYYLYVLALKGWFLGPPLLYSSNVFNSQPYYAWAWLRDNVNGFNSNIVLTDTHYVGGLVVLCLYVLGSNPLGSGTFLPGLSMFFSVPVWVNFGLPVFLPQPKDKHLR